MAKQNPDHDEYLNPGFFRELADNLGTQFADAMICDPRWPKCNQTRAISAARAIVARAIRDIVETLNEGAEFKKYTPMMASVMRDAFEASLPSKS